MTDRRVFAGSLAAAGSWTLGYLATFALCQGMSAASAYAVIVGWWFTAYVSSHFALPVAAAIPIAVGYLALFLIASFSGETWFYRDIASLSMSMVFGLGVVQALAIGSPILFDGLFRQAVRLFWRRRSEIDKEEGSGSS